MVLRKYSDFLSQTSRFTERNVKNMMQGTSVTVRNYKSTNSEISDSNLVSSFKLAESCKKWQRVLKTIS